MKVSGAGWIWGGKLKTAVPWKGCRRRRSVVNAGGRKDRQVGRRAAGRAKRRSVSLEQLEQRPLLTHTEGSPFLDDAGSERLTVSHPR
jgi:hypothetical protein